MQRGVEGRPVGRRDDRVDGLPDDAGAVREQGRVGAPHDALTRELGREKALAAPDHEVEEPVGRLAADVTAEHVESIVRGRGMAGESFAVRPENVLPEQ